MSKIIIKIHVKITYLRYIYLSYITVALTVQNPLPDLKAHNISFVILIVVEENLVWQSLLDNIVWEALRGKASVIEALWVLYPHLRNMSANINSRQKARSENIKNA